HIFLPVRDVAAPKNCCALLSRDNPSLPYRQWTRQNRASPLVENRIASCDATGDVGRDRMSSPSTLAGPGHFDRSWTSSTAQRAGGSRTRSLCGLCIAAGYISTYT